MISNFEILVNFKKQKDCFSKNLCLKHIKYFWIYAQHEPPL
jgi:hypothetical protein